MSRAVQTAVRFALDSRKVTQEVLTPTGRALTPDSESGVSASGPDAFGGQFDGIAPSVSGFSVPQILAATGRSGTCAWRHSMKSEPGISHQTKCILAVFLPPLWHGKSFALSLHLLAEVESREGPTTWN